VGAFGTFGTFIRDADAIFDAAQAASDATAAPTDFTVLIGPEGGIQMLADSDWPLASLALHHGARALYRVSRSGGQVTVEGRSGTQRCRLETETPQSVARRLLAGPVPCLPWNA